MTIRPYQPSDKTELEAIALTSGFPYPDLDGPLLEACLVIRDDNGEILAAIAAQRIIELYMYKHEGLRPSVSKAILNAMHSEMAKALRAKGYSEANCFLPPSLCERFGRRLQRSWNWVANWPSFCVRF